MTRRRILPPTYLYGAIAVMLALHGIVPLARIFPVPWNLLGLLPLVAGVILNLWADRAFKRHRTTVKPFVESNALVTEGPYRFSRNPMYLGMVVGLIGIAVLLGTLSPYLVIPVFVTVISRVFIRVEESMLAAQFGPSWVKYCQEVRRWL